VVDIRKFEYVRTLSVSDSSIICGLIWVANLQTYYARNIFGILIMTNMLIVKIFEVVTKKLNMCKIYACVVRFPKRIPPPPPPLGNKIYTTNIAVGQEVSAKGDSILIVSLRSLSYTGRNDFNLRSLTYILLLTKIYFTNIKHNCMRCCRLPVIL
jgi:hypothetical protein